MLILQRHPGQSIWVGKDIQIVVLGHSNGITRIGINAPVELTIVREEIKTKKKGNQS
jgi:carbon storage regulator CsrA